MRTRWLRTLLALTLLSVTACSLKSEKFVTVIDEPPVSSPPADPPDDDFDISARGALTVPTLAQNVIRTSSILNNSVVPAANTPAQQAIDRASANLPMTTDPGKIYSTSVGAQVVLDWGFCAQLSTNAAVMTSFGINRAGGTVANRLVQLEAFAVTLFTKATGIPEGSPPSKLPTLFVDFRSIIRSQLADLQTRTATLDQASASVCAATLVGARQIGF